MWCCGSQELRQSNCPSKLSHCRKWILFRKSWQVTRLMDCIPPPWLTPVLPKYCSARAMYYTVNYLHSSVHFPLPFSASPFYPKTSKISNDSLKFLMLPSTQHRRDNFVGDNETEFTCKMPHISWWARIRAEPKGNSGEQTLLKLNCLRWSFFLNFKEPIPSSAYLNMLII